MGYTAPVSFGLFLKTLRSVFFVLLLGRGMGGPAHGPTRSNRHLWPAPVKSQPPALESRINHEPSNFFYFTLSRKKKYLEIKYMNIDCLSNYHRFRWYATLENKTLAETFPKFPSVLRVIDRSDRNPPITTTSVTFWPSLRHASELWLVDFDPICR